MHVRTQRGPELLAPAGGPDALHAAVANGADAVYLGVGEFNARRGAENFTLETLPEATRFAHLRGSRVYLTLNIALLPDEVARALDVAERAWEAGVDAVIVQDLGLLRELRRVAPHIRVHASTQFNAHSASSVRALCERGAARVTLARETSVDEIESLARAAGESGCELESFVHGALCVCYSGQCLLSSLIGQRSANRGLCAQPCRLPYELVTAEGGVTASVGQHLLSPKDLAGIGQLDRLAEAGVASLKIEGRMKSADYVAVVTGVYREALDRAVSDPEHYQVRSGEIGALSEAFNRGFSEAYLAGERGNDMMSYQRPNNRGVLVGRIAGVLGDRARISLEVALDAEDTIEVWTSQGRFAQRAGALLLEGADVNGAPAGATVEVRLEGQATSGDRVFRVRNAALTAAAGRTYEARESSAPVGLAFAVRLELGRPLTVTVTDASGREATAAGGIVEPARTKSVTADEVAGHVGRLGGTAYVATRWDIALSPGVGVGFSELHRVRRDALVAYERLVLAQWERPRVEVRPERLPSRAAGSGPVEIVAVVDDMASAEACLAAGAHAVHVPFDRLAGVAPTRGVMPLLSRIAHDSDEPAMLEVARVHGSAVCGTLGTLAVCAQAGLSVEAHWSLNALNAHAVAELSELGAVRVWLSPELSSRQILDVATMSTVEVGTAVSGRQEVMVTEHCVLMAEGDCSRRCAECGRRRALRFLKDRMGYRFPVRTDDRGRTHIYNSVPLDLVPSLSEVLHTGVGALRLDLELLGPRQAADEVARVMGAVGAARAGLPLPERDRDATTAGHFFRGVR